MPYRVVRLDIGAAVRGQEYRVAHFHLRLNVLAVLVQCTFADSDNKGLVKDLLGFLWNKDARSGFLRGLDPLEKNAIKKGDNEFAG